MSVATSLFTVFCWDGELHKNTTYNNLVYMLWGQGWVGGVWENTFLKGLIANILGFIDHTVSVTII